MIPKPLTEIGWADIEALRDRGREEDDTIEYKGGFTGGSDFLALSEQQRKNAVDSIAREVVAFLNARGGDVIIGAQEARNENPVIEAISPVANVLATTRQLDDALSALIEPRQAIIGVKAVRQTDDDTNGVIVVRAPSSLRAPHRTSRDKDCYIRRGSKSVPMPMDEVQDVTLNRALARSDRIALMDSLFADMVDGIIGYRRLPAQRFGIRMAFVPYNSGEVLLSEECLIAMTGNDSPVYLEGQPTTNTVAFRQLPEQWRPILRGRQKENFVQYAPDNLMDFEFARKMIRSDGVMISDFSCNGIFPSQSSSIERIHFEWIVGFFSNQLRSIRSVLNTSPNINFGAIRTCLYVSGDFHLTLGNHFAQNFRLPGGLTTIPDFEYSSDQRLDVIFEQLQKDVLAIAGQDRNRLWSLDPMT
jgi:hypothetical protein